MNSTERQALRNKHLETIQDGLETETGCMHCVEEYPCDVIKVLDATEPSTAKCDHHGVDNGGTDYYGTNNPPQEWDWNYRYCPKCGEKL